MANPRVMDLWRPCKLKVGKCSKFHIARNCVFFLPFYEMIQSLQGSQVVTFRTLLLQGVFYVFKPNTITKLDVLRYTSKWQRTTLFCLIGVGYRSELRVVVNCLLILLFSNQLNYNVFFGVHTNDYLC